MKETNPKDDTLPRENKRWCRKKPLFGKHDEQWFGRCKTSSLLAGGYEHKNSNNCVTNNAKWQTRWSCLLLAKFWLASWCLATPVFCVGYLSWSEVSFPFSFCPIFTSLYSLVFTTLPISLLALLPCIIHEWHACCYTPRSNSHVVPPRGGLLYASL